MENGEGGEETHRDHRVYIWSRFEKEESTNKSSPETMLLKVANCPVLLLPAFVARLVASNRREPVFLFLFFFFPFFFFSFGGAN